jgi:integrase
MATIRTYTLASGAKRLRVRYRTPEGKSTDKSGFTTKRDAQAFAATVEVSKLRGEYVAPAAGRVTVGDLGRGWLDRQAHLKPSHTRVLASTWANHVEPKWKDSRLTAVRTTDAQAWVSELSTRRSASVTIRAFGVLAGILDDAVSDRLIARNPVRGVTLPRKPHGQQIFLTHAEVAGLAKAAGDHSTLVLLLAYTGLRWGEATELRVGDLDLLRKRITVTRNAVRSGGAVEVGTPKSGRGRTVPIPGLLVAELAKACEGKPRSGLLFTNAAGGYLRPNKWFAAAVKTAGVPAMTPHGLRHVYAGLAVQSGASVKTLQSVMGHASAAMTLDRYAGLFAGDVDAVADRLDQAATESVGVLWVKGPKSSST